MSILTEVMTKLLIYETRAIRSKSLERHSFECTFWSTKTLITFEQRKIEFCPLYVFYLFFEEESNGVSLFKVLKFLFFKKKLAGGGSTKKIFFSEIISIFLKLNFKTKISLLP